jgi:uncharacterized protein
MNTLEKKINQVKTALKKHKKVLVAFSGGKDSFFLLKIAVETLGKENAAACFVTTGFTTTNDRKRVEYFSQRLDFNLEKIAIDISKEKKIMANPKDRCYYCKKKIFSTLKKKAGQLNIDAVLDGTTYSDLREYRPGLKAIEELSILSPLRDARISSPEIVAYLENNENIDDYYLTSSTCLATRFPYDLQLNEKMLDVFDQIETYLVEQKIYPIKIRFIQDGVRIETSPRHFPGIIEKRGEIIRFCKNKGLKFITLDLEGIKTGVWD